MTVTCATRPLGLGFCVLLVDFEGAEEDVDGVEEVVSHFSAFLGHWSMVCFLAQ